jgi:TM2 domain-containing membrane protein YozV
MASRDEERGNRESVDLKDPGLAAFLAWLIPGLGHLYQGRTAKAALFFVCIMGTFLYGLYLGSSNEVLPNGDRLGWGRVVYFSWRVGEKRLAYLCQVGIGLPALPALVQASRMSSGKKVWWDGFMAPPRMGPPHPGDPNHSQPTADELNKHLHPYLELGKHFTMIAGLLNVLAIYDAWGGPVFSETAKKEEEEDQEDHSDATPSEVAS